MFGRRPAAKIASIVFVHGLRGHPQATWETSRKTPNRDRRSGATSKRESLKAFFTSRTPSKAKDRNGDDEEPSQDGIFWPSDFLDHDLPDARLWTYGYNANVIGIFEANNQNSVSQHGRDLSIQLERDIDNEVRISSSSKKQKDM
jgi:hypothetical protein